MNNYKLQQGLDALDRIKLLMEYDMSKTLTENELLLEQPDEKFDTRYNKEILRQYNKKSVGGGDAINYLKTQGLVWFFDKLREFLFSIEGIALDVFLNVSLPALGKAISVTVYGALLSWELYQLYEQGFGFTTVTNVIFAALGVIFPVLAKSTKVEIGAAKSFSALKPATRLLFKEILDKITKGMSSILKYVNEGVIFIEKYFGPQNFLKNIAKSIGEKLKQVIEWVNKNLVGQGGKLNSTRLAVASSKALHSAVVFKGIEKSLHGAIETDIGKKLIQKAQQFLGSDKKISQEQCMWFSILMFNPNLENSKNVTYYRQDSNGDLRFNIDSKIYILRVGNTKDPNSPNFMKLEIWK
jgi:hypothetical protein